MNIDNLLDILERDDGLTRTLGIEFVSTAEPHECVARMKVNHRNRQPFGFLSGGATLALAENVAGVGSMAMCPGRISVGINVSGSHLKAVLEGDTVTARARLLHKGSTLHQWNVEITNEDGDLISTVMVTNYVVTPRKNQSSTINETGMETNKRV